MMIVQTIFVRSITILSDQNAFLLSYNIMEEGLVKIQLDQDDRENLQNLSDHMGFVPPYDRLSAI